MIEDHGEIYGFLQEDICIKQLASSLNGDARFWIGRSVKIVDIWKKLQILWPSGKF